MGARHNFQVLVGLPESRLELSPSCVITCMNQTCLVGQNPVWRRKQGMEFLGKELLEIDRC